MNSSVLSRVKFDDTALGTRHSALAHSESILQVEKAAAKSRNLRRRHHHHILAGKSRDWRWRNFTCLSNTQAAHETMSSNSGNRTNFAHRQFLGKAHLTSAIARCPAPSVGTPNESARQHTYATHKCKSIEVCAICFASDFVRVSNVCRVCLEFWIPLHAHTQGAVVVSVHSFIVSCTKGFEIISRFNH